MMKIRGRSSFVRNYSEASKKLRTASGKKKGLGKKRKQLEAQEQKERRRETGVLIGALREVLKK